MALTRRHRRAYLVSVMTRFFALPASLILALSACDSMTGPIDGGDFDPLRAPGRGSRAAGAEGSLFSAGQFVRAAIDNTAFFKRKPNGDADADRVLPRGTSMKVISLSGSYVKVELDSGEVGFVPAVMLEDPRISTEMPATLPGESQVFPVLPDDGLGNPLPTIDPSGLPPEGSIPQVIDPDAPAASTPLPPITPSTDSFPAPSEPSLPLPPNGRE